MHIEYTKEDHEPSYDNLTSTVGATKKTSQTYDIRQIVTKPIFKWAVLVTVVTVLTIIVVVPTVLEITKEGSINGNWGNWTAFSDCTQSCGGGKQYRIRNCDHPSPSFGGVWCPGNDKDFQSCNNETCPLLGGWGSWTLSSECSKSCGGGAQTRQRECNNPSPAYGGDTCSGNENETRSCNTEVCPVHGSWGSWTAISGCSHSCGGGTRYRLRMCNNPNPSFGGNWCPGNATEFQQCNTPTCPDYRSAFTVRSPQDGPTSGTIKFSVEITNIGGHYQRNTGRFICKYPGVYVFIVHMYTSHCSTHASCYIRNNNINIVLANIDPDDRYKCFYYSSTASVVLSLARGDIVDLGDCSSVSTMREWTSFSGYLLKAD